MSDKLLYGEGLLGESLAPTKNGLIREKFMVPPFSILNGMESWWSKRRRTWQSFGFKSELGRAENLLKFSPAALDAGGGNGTGIFDPVLCELAYRWFCPPNGTVIDPFSGGCVRGIVAAMLDYKYIGCDLREEQIVENRKQAKDLNVNPQWFIGDSRNFAENILHQKGDFIFSSPPYFYREHYSDLPEDLNNSKTYDEFRIGYFQAIDSCCSCLNNDCFACFEVAEIRDKNGIAPDFVGDTIRGFVAAGLQLYNHAIHAKPLASAAIRTNMFSASRKFVPIHEHVLVFVKGNPKIAAKKCAEF